MLQVQTYSSSTLLNTGLLSAANGTLILSGGSITNTGAAIQTGANGAIIVNTGISGGSVAGLGGGSITLTVGVRNVALSGNVIAAGASSTQAWTGTASNAGTLTVAGNTPLNPTGATVISAYTLTNIGLVQINNSTSLFINGPITLNGGGTVSLLGPSAGIIGTGNTNTTFTTDNMIAGQGTLSARDLTNTGIISATAGSLVLSFNTATNLGTLRANGGTLQLSGGSYANAGGLIEASANSVVKISSIVMGGTVRGNGGTVTTSSATLGDLTTEGNIQLATSALTGLINNIGTIGLGASTLSVNGTLAGNGILLMTSPASQISSLVSNSGKISGQGSISNFQFNSGTITATGGTLTLPVGVTTTNAGTMASDAGTLVIAGTVLGGQFTTTATGKLVINGIAQFINIDNLGQTTLNGRKRQRHAHQPCPNAVHRHH